MFIDKIDLNLGLDFVIEAGAPRGWVTLTLFVKLFLNGFKLSSRETDLFEHLAKVALIKLRNLDETFAHFLTRNWPNFITITSNKVSSGTIQ